MEKETKLSDIEIKILEILTKYITDNEDGSTMEYGELAKEVEHWSVIPHNLGLYLGRVSSFCIQNNAPPISVIVVGQDSDGKYSGMPGKGFYDLLGYPSLNQNQVISVFVEKLREVYNFNEWDKVLEKARDLSV
jgi:hypothetical protein